LRLEEKQHRKDATFLTNGKNTKRYIIDPLFEDLKELQLASKCRTKMSNFWSILKPNILNHDQR
jgi:hypothetical protein